MAKVFHFALFNSLHYFQVFIYVLQRCMVCYMLHLKSLHMLTWCFCKASAQFDRTENMKHLRTLNLIWMFKLRLHNIPLIFFNAFLVFSYPTSFFWMVPIFVQCASQVYQVIYFRYYRTVICKLTVVIVTFTHYQYLSFFRCLVSSRISDQKVSVDL